MLRFGSARFVSALGLPLYSARRARHAVFQPLAFESSALEMAFLRRDTGDIVRSRCGVCCDRESRFRGSPGAMVVGVDAC